MNVTVNGHGYELWPREAEVNPDYLVQAAPGGNLPVLGLLEWRGNGTSNFSYRVMDSLDESLGTFPTMLAALSALDVKVTGGS